MSASGRFSALLQLAHPLVLARHRYLLLQLTRRDVLSRYKGSMLGPGWALLYPLLILAAYTFVFRAIFKARWPGGADSTAEFALQVFAGLIIFNLFAELLGRAPKLVLEQPNLVKRVVFPLEMLSWVAVASTMLHALLALVVLLVAMFLVGPGLSAWVFALPLVLCACVPVLLGLGWLLSALGIFLRDIGQAMGPVVSLLLFLSPVLYPLTALPKSLATVSWLNPLALPIESLRRILFAQSSPDWSALGIYTLVGLAFAALSHRLFERLRPAFADEV